MRAKDAYWDPSRPDIIQNLGRDPNDLTKEELVKLVLELDRRFIQLWDKVVYERKNNKGSVQ